VRSISRKHIFYKGEPIQINLIFDISKIIFGMLLVIEFPPVDQLVGKVLLSIILIDIILYLHPR